MPLNLVDRIIGVTYGKRRFQRMYRRVHHVALTGMNYGYSDPELNGEHAFLDRVIKQWSDRPAVAYDVGAFHGTWSAAVLARAPTAIVHAFEPIANSHKQLAANLDGIAQAHHCAIGARTETAEMYAPVGHIGEHASLYDRDLSGMNVAVEAIGSVSVRSLDEFCAEQQIEHIDLLKLDTEGHELSVLEGAQRLLEARAIDTMQFEFGGANIDSRTFLRDIVGVLSPTHKVYRLLKDGLEPVRLDEREEIFTYANYIALPT
jgi:FkbM family methyltransferase